MTANAAWIRRRRRRASGGGGGEEPPFESPILEIASLWSWQRRGALLYADSGGTTPAVHGGPVNRWGDSSGNSRLMMRPSVIASHPALWSWQKQGAGLFTDAGITPAVNHGDAIARWGDASGNGRHWPAATATEPTLDTGVTYNGAATVDCTGAGGFVLPDMSGLTEGEIFVVLKENSPNTGGGAWNLGSQDFNSHFTNSGIHDGFGSTVRRSPGGFADTSVRFHIYNSYSATNAWRAFLDGTALSAEITTNTVSFPAAPRFGISNVASPLSFQGRVAHVVIFSAKLSDADRSAVTAELTQPPVLDTATTYGAAATVDFDGADGLLLPDMSGLSAAEMFVVLKAAADPGLQHRDGAWDMGSQDFNSHFSYNGEGGTTGDILDGFGSTVRRTSGNPASDLSAAFHIYSVYSASNAWRAFLDGTALSAEITTNTVSFPAAPRFGRSWKNQANSLLPSLGANVADVLLFSEKLSDADRAIVVAELTAP